MNPNVVKRNTIGRRIAVRKILHPAQTDFFRLLGYSVPRQRNMPGA